ncbi:hypothetical protein [Rubellimicrobium arenae]|uniref:hypothetical protein n=1 Tax=Rubellimicrobium arenae TaxID=2817372 RepID=UPI001B30B650|nr:hypothetical protein [Rubellimicrobium arenae]
MRNVLTSVIAGIFLSTSAGSAFAADSGDPDWPCIQRKIDHLSIGVMWPTPIPEGAAPLPEELEEVAARLALRRVSEEDAREMVARVAADHPDFGTDDFGRLFQTAFAHIDRQRADIVAGIGRYAHNQARLSAELEELRAEMSRLEAADPPDYDRMDEVEKEIDWRVRIFNDRNRALTYVCESPVLLEQRAYAIAQIMLNAVDE